MLGPLINSGAIIFGGLAGARLARFIPERLQKGLPATFALASAAIGISMIVKVHFLPVMVMALILGTAIGEFCYLEHGVSRAAKALQQRCKRWLPLPHGLTSDEFAGQFTAIIVLFGASGLGVVGAMTEGLNGDYQLLLVKSMMDFITAIIFAISLGPSVAAIALVQFLVQVVLFAGASVVMPYMDAVAYADFSAVGGIIMLAVGLRIAQIMKFAVVNFLPALLLVLPFSYLWRHFWGG
ncbi:hypothetical protein SAMN05880558_101524 [Aeromonas sp. RU39B]|jgi:uncharacterized membrane protein YqgA involved in biofilm formation|uniref:DUF554 domain-containing protein n=1 Tax=Aeromonas sp. RU39B TaxID=1907416 RepID=UPI000955441D|nr:DUF554 domain-containing protein [Aeromonas sp. RU39B]SIQ01939.1 hypothetical protein SAMN05880558_101524 [Aeromonas sp. RU39B]